MAKAYKYLLFDLDHTLWDFEKNSQETLTQLFYEFELDISLKSSVNDFIKQYEQINYQLWKEYELGKIEKSELRWKRFYVALEQFGYKEKELSELLAEKYLSICPYKTNLIPYTEEILDEFHQKCKMVIITNGFEEVQAIKMQKSGLNKYFDIVISSEAVGHKKPAAPIFKRAMDEIGGNRKESLMIGDNFHSDIIGAKKFGIDQAYYNPKRNRHNQKPTYDVSCLSELIKIIVLD